MTSRANGALQVNCQEYIEHYLGADADGELSADERQATSQHLATCPKCAARLASERALKVALRSRLPIVSTPAEVRREIIDRLDRIPAWSISNLIRQFSRPLRWTPVAIAAMVLLVVLYGRLSERPAVPAFDQAVAAFSEFETGFVPNVPSNSLASLTDTYRAQLGIPIAMWDLGKLGYKLAGGRLDHLSDDRPVAYTLYTGPHGHILCTFQRMPGFLVPPGGRQVNAMHHFYRYKDLSICLTTEGDVVCILTSRMPLADLISTIKSVES